MKTLSKVGVIPCLLLLAACGSTSEIKPTAPAAPPPAESTATTDQGAAATVPSPYSHYSRVVVLDFEDGTDKSKIPAGKQTQYTETMKIAVRNFADRIAGEVTKTGAFDEVLREPTDQPSLRISGVITRYVSGNAALRLLIGLGAGSSYFDATVNLADNVSGESLGQVTVDRNSWGLGGIIAATQNVEGFMQGAAEKIAKDLAQAKTGTVATPPAK